MLNARLDRSPVTRAGRWASALVVLAMTLPIAAFAEGGFATFSGTVVDPQDRALPAATIIVSDTRRDARHETKTDRSGHFELVGLPAGDYTIEAKVPGFRALRETFGVNGQSVDRTLKMQVAELQETITVVSDDGAVTSTGRRRPSPSSPSRRGRFELTPSSARISRVGIRFSFGGPSPFLSFVTDGSTRQSATAATRIAASAGKAAMTASAMSSAVSTSIRSTPTGVASATGPATRVTRAPAAAAAAAIANPCRPDERFAMTRTGSIGS